MKQTSDIMCCECGYSVATSSSEKVWLCDNPNLKTFGKNVKHGSRFSCGYGVWWKELKQPAQA